jgi:hypothetical protein
MPSRPARRNAIALVVVAAASIALAAPAWAAAPPRTGSYVGTSTSNATGNRPQPFSMSVSHGSCAAPGSSRRRRTYCVTVNVQSDPQTTCSDGSIVEEFFPIFEPIALSPARTISHTYTLYSDAGGQISDTHLPGTSAVGTFEFSLSVSTSGTATGTMNYSVAGCNSGPLTIKAKRKR